MKKSMLTKLFALVLTVCVVFSLAIIVSSAAEPALVATFNLGDNGSATHKDGSSAKTTYSETDGSYTLSITGGDKMYPSSIDAKGNGCIKFGSSSAAGKMSFTVPDDVTSVILYVAKYKANTSKVTVNGTTSTLTKASNDGEYDAIKVDTSSTKTVTFTTVSGGYRVMLNTIEFYAAASACTHSNTTAIGNAKDATCTETGLTAGLKCADCGEIMEEQATIPALGHDSTEEEIITEATCTTAGEKKIACSVCGESVTEAIPATGHVKTTTTVVDAQHGVAGSKTVTCDKCGVVTSSSTIPALWNATFVSWDGEEDVILGSTVTTPKTATTAADDSYVLVGWSTVKVAEGTKETPDGIVKTGVSLTLTEDVTYYAVYAKTEGSAGYIKTDISEIKSGDVFIVAMISESNVYALSSSNGTSSAPTAVAVTVSNDVISSAAENLLWNLGGDASGYIFYPNGSTSTWLYCTNSNNGVRVGNNSNKTFTINKGYLFHTVESRYVGVYNNADWRCYGPDPTTNSGSNIKNQSVAFYVQGTLDITYTSSFGDTECEHEDATVVTKDATCETAGSITTTCSCGFIGVETIEALGHDYVCVETEAPSCTATGVMTYTCNNDDLHTYTEVIPMTSHNYVDGECTGCGKEEPKSSTITFDDTSKRTEFDTTHQVWVENGITVTNNKGSGNNMGDYSAPIRLYKGSILTIVSESDIYKIVFNANATGEYLDNLVSTIGSGSCTVEGTSVTVKFAEPVKSFTLTLAGQIRLDSIELSHVIECEHPNTEPAGEAKNATCTELGLTAGVKCSDCEKILEEPTAIPVIAHNYENNTCTACGTVMVGRFYIATKRPNGGNFFWLTNAISGDYYITATNSGASTLPYEILDDNASSTYIFVLERLGDVYYIYAEGIDADEKYIGWSNANSGNTAIFVKRVDAVALTKTGETENTSQFCFNDGETTRFLSLYNNSKYNYFAFYATEQLQNLSFIPVVDEATDIPENPIESVSVKLGTDLAVLYNVLIPNGEPTKMVFEFGGKNYEITDFTYTGYGIYQFEFSGIGPHQMATVINASLYVGENVVGTHENYSINKNLNNIYDGSNDSVKAIIDAARAYGIKAAAYVTGNADVTVDLSGVEIKDTTKHFPTSTDTSLAYFKSAGVYYDVTNKIFVKFYAIEGFSITIKKGTEVIGTYDADTCESLGDNTYKLYTGDITPIEFNDYFSFSITFEGQEVAKLSYTVNGYALAMQDSGIPQYVADLAKALYAYGVAVENYKA